MKSDPDDLRTSLRKNAYVRYLREFRDLKKLVFLGNLFAFIQAISLVPISIFFKRIIDTYIPRQQPEAIAEVVAIGIALWLVHIASTVLSRYFTLRATKTVTERLRANLTMKLQQMSLRFYDNEKTGDLHARVILDTERVDVMANSLVVHIFVSVAIALSASLLLAYINLHLFALLFLLAPFYFIIRSAFAKKLKDGHGDFRQRMEQMSSIVSEVLHSIRLVKSFAMEKFEQRRVEERLQRVTRRGVRLFTEAAAFQILLQCVGGMATLAIFTVGGWMVINNEITVGDVVAFSVLTAYFLNPINTLISLTDTIYAGHAGLVSIYGLMDVYDTEQTEHLPEVEVHGGVDFDNLCFGYTDENPVLREINLSVTPGQQIALVGNSGAGKTTLVNLLLGFYTPTAGCIRIDGVETTAMNLRRLREQIGVVSQDNVLVSGSIRNNIRYGNMAATQDEIEQAAIFANAHDFISAMPAGYDTEIGERGARLSGGQKQRIAIARAILKKPKILILDEATSALDSESELAVQDALERLRENRTSFVIAHRLSTIQRADLILVMRNGSVVERGTFGELLNRGGEFTRFYKIQYAKSSELALPLPA
jgi:subfamily B ATP-binding cassette protein MsbA